jgi:hypothetical protein
VVGPTREDTTSTEGYRYLAAAFVALLALSGGSVAFQDGASALVAVLVAGGGALVGLVLVYYLRWSLGG